MGFMEKGVKRGVEGIVGNVISGKGKDMISRYMAVKRIG